MFFSGKRYLGYGSDDRILLSANDVTYLSTNSTGLFFEF